MSRHFKIITKEVGRDNPIETKYIGDVDRAYLIKFFGLHERDVEWFRIEELQKDGCREQRKTRRAALLRLLVVWIVVFQRTVHNPSSGLWASCTFSAVALI